MKLNIVFVLLGSKGDIHAGIAIAHGLCYSSKWLPGSIAAETTAGRGNAPADVLLHIVSHRDLCHFYRPLLPGSGVPDSLCSVVFHPISTDSFETGPGAPNGEGGDPHRAQRDREERDMVAAFENILRTHGRRVDLVVFNLFAYNSWNLAEASGAPSIALTSFPAALSSAPARFAEQFGEMYPKFAAALRSYVGEGFGVPSGKLSWADIETFQWRMFLDDSEAFRSRIGLESIPFEDCILAFEEGAAEGSRNALPPSTPLLSTIWPELATVLDSQSPSRHRQGGNIRYVGLLPELPLPPEQHEFAEMALSSLVASHPEGSSRIVLLYFGSMERLSLRLQNRDDVVRLCRELTHAVSQRPGTSIIWTTSRVDGETTSWIREASPAVVLFCLPPGLSFPSLVSRFLAAGKDVLPITHGGSGTAQSLLELPVPQLLVPLRFDQGMWGEAVEALGRGRRVELDVGAEEWGRAMDWGFGPVGKEGKEGKEVAGADRRKALETCLDVVRSQLERRLT
ncbi:hypothetical protein DFJ74DRAFT_115290 [Hyaloraphidium curvatum]|nr:hypothetical protein DFJ74DRAFT_115290 [Hyaloraphidium curvatum]